MNLLKSKLIFSVSICILGSLVNISSANAAVSFVSASNSTTLAQTIDEGSERVFVFSGLADGSSSDFVFSTDSSCPGVAMTGGAEFASHWSCSAGVITATVTNRGGMSFGPSPDGNAGTFYITFSDPPAPPGSETVPAALSGIQIAVFGDVSSWNLSGEPSASGATFGVELSGTQGGSAHFRMYLPEAAANYLGGVLGVYVGGKPDPFASVTNNEDGSVDINVDIASLSSGASTSSIKLGSKANIVTKKITTGARALNIGFNKSAVKTGKSVSLAMCSGTEFSLGDRVPVKFTVGGKASSIKKTLVLDAAGCAKSTLQLKSVSAGTLTAKITYKGKTAKGTVKITK